MPEVVNCPTCQRKSRVPDNLLGKKVKCPGCGGIFTAEVQKAAAPAPAPAPKAAEEEKEDDRETYDVADGKTKRRKSRREHDDDDDDDDRPRRGRGRRDDDDDDDDARPKRRRRRYSRDDDDDDDDDSGGRPQRQGTDGFGVASLIFGILSLLLVALGCCCIIPWFLAAPLALLGGVLGFFARSGMRTAGLAINALCLLLSISLSIAFFTGNVAWLPNQGQNNWMNAPPNNPAPPPPPPPVRPPRR